MDDLVAKALHAARRHFENGGDAPVIPPEFTSDTAGTPVDFRPLNFDALRQANAVRVTNRANPDGTTDTDPNAGFSIVSGWNDSMAQHGDPRSTVTWPDNPEAYGTVADMFANNPEWVTPHKYRQILHSARELGMRDEDVYAQPRAHGGEVDAALHAVRHHLAGGGFLSDLFSGPDYLSTGKEASFANMDPNSETNADFFKADRAMRLAREVQAADPDRAPLTAPRPGPVEVQELPVNIPFTAPERGASLLSSDISPASVTSLPLAYTAAPAPAPAQAAISTVAIPAAEKLTARAPQDVEPTVTNARILAAIRANESRNNPKAQNPTSSAGGLYQFLNSTWGNTLRRMDPERFGAYNDRQLRGLKTDPNAVDLQHAAANYHLANDIAPRLSKAGVPLTPGSAYLSWFQGPGGAVRAYTAPENATVAQVFPKTVSANANMRFNGKPYAQWTMSDLRQWADTAMAKRMGRAEGGLVDDALHVVREHHADGEAVGQGPEMSAEEPRPLTIYRGNAPVADEAGGSGREPAPPAFSYMPTPESVARQASRQPAYNPAERTWSDAGSTEGERLTRALGVEGELPKGETTMSAQPTSWERYMPQRRPGTFLKRWGEAFNENADAVEEGIKAIRAGNYGSGALGMVGGGLGMAMSPLTGMERVLVRDPILQYTGDLKKAQQAEVVADTVATGGIRGMVTPFAKAGSLERMATEPWNRVRLPSPAAAGAATAAGAMLAPEDAEASKLSKAMEVARMAIPRELSPMGFYSHGAEAARGLAQAKGTPEQFAAMLQKSGVKGPEMEGFLKTFGGRPIVTQDEAAQYFKGAMPQVEETVLGAVPTQKLKVLPSEEGWNIVNHRGDVIDTYPHGDMGWEDATRAARTRMNTDFSDTKFGGYTLPGGENYREVLLKMPQSSEYVVRNKSDQILSRHPDRASALAEMQKQKVDDPYVNIDKASDIEGFKSQHWDDPNVLAHLRLADRTGPNGEKILHVEEIQSDWGQQGKKEGFKQQPDPTKETPLLEAKQDAQFAWEKARSDFLKGHEDYQKTLQDQTMRMAERWGLTPEEIAADHAKGAQEWANMSPRQKLAHAQSEFMRSENPTALPHYAQRDAEVAAAQEREKTRNALFAYQKSIDTGIPSAPYVTNTQAWTDLALKRALKEAAEGGYDKLVWTPGAEQAKRYDLSRHVDNITWSAEPDGKYWVGATKDGRPVRGLENEPMDVKKLEATFGKEIAEKIVKGEGKKMVGGPEMELSGLDLQTGGSGMKGYYDKIVPNQLSKLVKKLDPEARVGAHEIPNTGEKRRQGYADVGEIMNWHPSYTNLSRQEQSAQWNAMSPVNRRQLIKDYESAQSGDITGHGIDITPAMRESILKGQTAFKDGGSVVDRALMLVSKQA
jgi:hypothetical protein